jgi:hypothetical protein
MQKMPPATLLRLGSGSEEPMEYRRKHVTERVPKCAHVGSVSEKLDVLGLEYLRESSTLQRFNLQCEKHRKSSSKEV